MNKAQSLGDSGHTEIFPSLEATDREEEVDTEIIHDSDNQSGDTVIVEHIQDKHQEPSDAKVTDKHVPTKYASQKKRVAEIKLRKLRKKCWKL